MTFFVILFFFSFFLNHKFDDFQENKWLKTWQSCFISFCFLLFFSRHPLGLVLDERSNISYAWNSWRRMIQLSRIVITIWKESLTTIIIWKTWNCQCLQIHEVLHAGVFLCLGRGFPSTSDCPSSSANLPESIKDYSLCFRASHASVECPDAPLW